MKKVLVALLVFIAISIQAQEKEYRAEREKVNKLIHTKLKVDFNFQKSQMNGEAWVQLTPYFMLLTK